MRAIGYADSPPPMSKPYHYLNHTADLGIEVRGPTLRELFVNIARAIFETQLAGKIESKKSINIELKGESLEDLFIDWCRELLYNFSVKGFIPKRYNVSIKDLSIKADIEGDIFDPKRHRITLEIKNPTYHKLRVEKKGKYYFATIIFDV